MRFAHLAHQLTASDLWGRAGLDNHQLIALMDEMQTFEGDPPSVGFCSVNSPKGVCLGTTLPAWSSVCEAIKTSGWECEKRVSQMCYDCARRGRIVALAEDGKECIGCEGKLQRKRKAEA